MTDQQTPRTTSAPGVSLQQATTWLEGHLGHAVSPLRTLRAGGWSNAYAYHDGDASFVVRFSLYRDDFEKDAFAMRWQAPHLPIPHVTHIGEAPSGYAAISRLVPGHSFDDLSANDLTTALPSLLAMLDALRTADVTTTKGYGGWDRTGNAPAATWADHLRQCATDEPTRRNHGWRAQLANSPVGIDRFDETFACLTELLPTLPNERYLIHSDLMNHNVLVNHHRISGVIDWGCGLYGDYLYDAAWIINYWPWRPAWNGIDIAAIIRQHLHENGVDTSDIHRRIHAYRLHMYLDDQAYQTYMRDWAEVEHRANLGLALARTPLDP